MKKQKLLVPILFASLVLPVQPQASFKLAGEIFLGTATFLGLTYVMLNAQDKKPKSPEQKALDNLMDQHQQEFDSLSNKFTQANELQKKAGTIKEKQKTLLDQQTKINKTAQTLEKKISNLQKGHGTITGTLLRYSSVLGASALSAAFYLGLYTHIKEKNSPEHIEKDIRKEEQEVERLKVAATLVKKDTDKETALQKEIEKKNKLILELKNKHTQALLTSSNPTFKDIAGFFATLAGSGVCVWTLLKKIFPKKPTSPKEEKALLENKEKLYELNKVRSNLTAAINDSNRQIKELEKQSANLVSQREISKLEELIKTKEKLEELQEMLNREESDDNFTEMLINIGRRLIS